MPKTLNEKFISELNVHQKPTFTQMKNLCDQSKYKAIRINYYPELEDWYLWSHDLVHRWMTQELAMEGYIPEEILNIPADVSTLGLYLIKNEDLKVMKETHFITTISSIENANTLINKYKNSAKSNSIRNLLKLPYLNYNSDRTVIGAISSSGLRYTN